MKYTLYLLLGIILIIGCSHNLHAQIITTYAGKDSVGYSGDGGAATNAKLYSPCGIAVDETGNIYFTDEQNYCVRKITPSGTISIVAGTGAVNGYSGNGGPATGAKLTLAWGVTIDASGNLYITDQNNHTVRKVNTAGIISSINNDTANISNGNGGPISLGHFKRPIGISVDAGGTLYIGDADAQVIRKVNSSGTIDQLTGVNNSAGYSGDGGPAINARVQRPNAISTDDAGNIYFCDAENHCVRKITPAGIINTIAGNGTAGFSGDGGAAVSCKLNNPTGVFADKAGNIWIADNLNNRIRRITRDGIINTVIGNGTPGYSGDNGLCTNARLFEPSNVVVDTAQNVFVTDTRNHRIRKVRMALKFTNGHSHNVHLCQNTSSISIDTFLRASDFALGLNDRWSLVPGAGPYHGTANVNFTAPASAVNITPSGCFYTPTINYSGKDTLRVLISNTIATDTVTLYFSIDPFLNNAGSIEGDSMVCVGSTILLTDTAKGGIWTISNLNAIVTGGLVTGESPGLDTITYIITNTCGTAKATKVITINPLPAIGQIIGASDVCVGGTISVNNSQSGGVWTASNGNAAIFPVMTTCDVKGILAGKDTIRYTTTNSFCSATVSKIININPLPTAEITGGVPALCQGSFVFLTGLPDGGIWTIENGNASFIQTSSGGMLSGLQPGTDSIWYRVTNSCGTAVSGYRFDVDTLPTKPTIKRQESVLYGTKGLDGYQWFFNGIALPGATSDTLLLTNEGQYLLTVTNAYGCQAVSDTLNFPGCEPDDLVIYPNPTESVVYVSWCKKVTLRVICMDGKTAGVSYFTNMIDLADLPNADYLLAIYDENGKKVKVKYITKLSK